MTMFSASLSTTSWPGRSASRSTFGLTFTRILRPPVNTSAVVSSRAARNTPKPDGGWARRSFCEVTEVSDASVSRSRSSSKRTWRGESASLRRNTAISSSRKEICAVRLDTSSSCREARPPSSLAATALTSSRERFYPDLTYLEHLTNIPARVHLLTGLAHRGETAGYRAIARPMLHFCRVRLRIFFVLSGMRALGRAAAARRRGHPGSEPPRGHQETGVPDHPVIRPHREPVQVPAARHRLPRGRLEEPAVRAQVLRHPRQLGRGGHVAADKPAGRQHRRRVGQALPGREHVEDHPVERDSGRVPGVGGRRSGQ